MVELVDTLDSKSNALRSVRVQVPPTAPSVFKVAVGCIFINQDIKSYRTKLVVDKVTTNFRYVDFCRLSGRQWLV